MDKRHRAGDRRTRAQAGAVVRKRDSKHREKRPADNGAETAAIAVDREEQLTTRAAWLYYTADMTQAQIAKRLGLNRVRVNRMLAQAREQGIVQIRINTRLASCVALEGKLAARFGLDEAIVVPTPADPGKVPHAVAIATGIALSDRIRDGMSVGVGWGRTLRMSLQSVTRRPVRKLSVVSLIGGLTRGSVMNAYETASHLADLFDAECFYVAAPVFTDSAATRDILMEQPMLREVFDKVRAVDLAVVSVGSLTRDATMLKLGLIERDDVTSLRRAGAVGDICAYWIDAEGRIIDHPLNRKVVALSPQELRDIPSVILASGGRDKVAPLYGALAQGYGNVLITDEATAEGILRVADGKAAQPPVRQTRASPRKVTAG
jgi:DNA-binding transcriptional regulator LsrR (DeoR family)